jgi:hypothetical protein
MYRFSIVALTGSTRDIPYLMKELRRSNLITGTEKDLGGEPVYLTHNIVAVKKIMEDYDNLTLDLHRE